MDITVIIAKIKNIMEEWFVLKENVPTKTSDLINDNDFITMQNIQPTKLKNGDNIDDLLTQGCYWINSNPDAESISGTFPINGYYAYVILVDGGEKVIRQIATVYKGQGTRTFVRMYSGYTSNFGWGEWKEVSFVGHAHGNLNDDGTITNADTSTNYTYFVGLDSNNAMRKVSKLKGSQVIDTTAHSNIGSSANATQATINTNIDTALGNIPKNVFYGTCSTAASAQTKVVSVSNWSFTTGNILFVKFNNGQTYAATSENPTKLSINSTIKNVASVSGDYTTDHFWRAGEVVAFIYDGTEFVMTKNGIAGTSYYGITKLSSAVDSTSQALASTPYATKQAYDLANGKADAVHTHTTSNISDPTAHSNIGSSANATQQTINTNIDTKLGTKADKTEVVDWDNIVFVSKTDDSTGSIILNFLS